MVSATFNKEYIAVLQGGAPETNKLVDERFDKIFFTGSPMVGSIIMEKAAKHLTPVVLELGGKSPTVVGKDANLKLAARRLVFGKGTNAGQTCVAPDYVLVHSEIKQAFIQAFKNEVVAFYGKEPLESQDYGKLINDKNYNRVKKYLGDGKILFGEETDDGLHKIGLTLLEIEDMDVPVMTEEIFGRVLPLITFETFTHKKSVFKGSTLVDLKVKYPPYNKKKIALIKKLMY